MLWRLGKILNKIVSVFFRYPGGFRHDRSNKDSLMVSNNVDHITIWKALRHLATMLFRFVVGTQLRVLDRIYI